VKFPSADRESFRSHAEFRTFLRHLTRIGIKKLEDLEAANNILDDFRVLG
jgi:hypothetical protein